MLFGTNIPASWTTNMGAAGLLARCTAASHVIDYSTQQAADEDIYDVIMGPSGTIALIEADGFMADGHLAATSLRGTLRGLRSKEYDGTSAVPSGPPIFVRSMQEGGAYSLDGDPMYFTTDGSMSAGNALLFTGQWNQLVWAMRQDVTYKVLDQAVLQDGAGNILYNLAQQDMVALRVVMRLGFALPNPINRVNQTAATRLAFSALVP